MDEASCFQRVGDREIRARSCFRVDMYQAERRFEAAAFTQGRVVQAVLRLRHGDARRSRSGEFIMRKWVMLITLVQILFAATTGMAAADQPNWSVRRNGLTVHFGIVPAEKASFVQDKGGAPGEATTGQGPASDHLVVALFDAGTGARIESAEVVAMVTARA
ncbi:hypothetical protein [Burkholderia anthina]|uniref:hypothetical protein n=1 Tax=Burkholderia anthina TaxID=179879 RepID=UPI001AA07759|nr:hypothetical protein [Burkholderia anthina]QTD91061.1 hypothetical protein J4G50_06675 [Burkholderia anthina]